MKVSLVRQVRPFYRRWRGWRRILWWLWPVRYAVVTENGWCTSYDYYASLGAAVDEFCRLTVEREEQS